MVRTALRGGTGRSSGWSWRGRLETLVRKDRTWGPLVLTVSVVVALTLFWRRTHPLAAVAVAFGTLIVFDVARILTIDANGLLSIAALLVLPYALFRWGSGREAADRPALALVSGQGRETAVAVPFALVSSAMHGAVRPQTLKAADGPSLPSYRHEEGLGAKLRAQRELDDAPLSRGVAPVRATHDGMTTVTARR